MFYPRKTHSIAVIIPVHNDRLALEMILPELLHSWKPEEILVVDACSEDGVKTYLEAHGCAWLSAPSFGRAQQQNFGAMQAKADVYLFLHADTRLPMNAKGVIRHAIEEGAVGGAFSRRFDSPSRFLRITSILADWRGRLGGWFLGDQAIFVRSDVFRAVGGFPEWPCFEDLELSRRVARLGPTRLLQPGVISSARRFSQGAVRRTWKDFWLTVQYLRGVESERLSGNTVRRRSSHESCEE